MFPGVREYSVRISASRVAPFRCERLYDARFLVGATVAKVMHSSRRLAFV
jgi:hypothetical protein